MNALIGIPLDCLLHLALVVGNVSTGFMMSDDLNILFTCITSYFIHIKVGIRFSKVKTLHTSPTFPSFVPPLKQHTFDVIGMSKINVFLGIGGCSAMPIVHLPGFHSQMHPPPDTDIFYRLDPVGGIQFTRFIQVKDQRRINQSDSLRSDLNGTPCSGKTILFTSFNSIGP